MERKLFKNDLSRIDIDSFVQYFLIQELSEILMHIGVSGCTKREMMIIFILGQYGILI